jgi:N-acetylmuramoyl-L-alanine amidase
MGIAAALAVCIALPVRADKKSDAREQFESAVSMRTMLEGYLEKDRTLSNYKQTISAYHKVYLTTPQADEVTPSLVAEGELYQEMGRLYDPKYFQSAVDVYNFLLKQYPGSRYRGEALLAIAQIQKDDLKKPDDAEASYTEYLKRFPRSDKAGDARAALKEIAANREPAADQPQAQDSKEKAPETQPGVSLQEVSALPELKGDRVEPRVSDKGTPGVTSIRTWNAPDSTRVVVALDDTIKFDAARISSPDRIYFDLYNAKLTSKFPSKSLDVQSGLLKSAHFAQNKQGVVRLVIDVGGVKDYTAYLLSNPYRLVIEVHAQPVTSAQVAPAPAPAAAPAAAPVAAPNVSGAKTVENLPAAAPEETVSAKSATSTSAKTPPAKPTIRVEVKANPEPVKKSAPKVATLEPPSEPKPTRDGDRSLTRALGLKVSRIVIDPGHGGHDTGTIGPHGLMEKDLCLDVALRLGNLIEQKLPGAEVIYTRKDDTFIPLEERTAIANREKADLFISIHANSSHDPAARGIETYYLNFATSAESMEVASRENANSQEPLHDLEDLIQKIARNEKIEESKELAGDIQDTLTARLQLVSHDQRNRGVKKAPFVVLIGANMPSVLSEISFVSNPSDEKLLRKADQRDRIADGLYRGITTYLDNMNSLSYNKQKLISDNPVSDSRLEAGTVASTGNPK